MTQLKLMLHGSPRMERDGLAVEVDTRKAIALMAYLAVTGQSHSRDALATLLWPDYDQTHARAALRRTLSALNKALAGDWLEADRENIALNPDAAIWVDAVEFQRHLATCRSHGHPAEIVCSECVAPLTEAAALYRDDFMAGFTLRDSPDFDEWQFFQTESLRRDLGRALENLVRCHTERREFDSAITYARRWLALDPLHEVAHRELMRLYAWAGQRGAALRQYRECVRIFDQELGVPPLEETTQLYEAIQENRLPAPPEPKDDKASRQIPAEGRKGWESFSAFTPAPPLPRSPAALPLVGRSTELTVLVEAYAAITGNGHLLVLEGEAGIGKTRLAEEFLTYVQTQGGVTLRARCYEGETNLAYGPFIEALRAAVSQNGSTSGLAALPAHWLSETVRLLPELASLRPGLPPAPPLDNPGAQSHFFEALSQALLTLCAGPSPGVLLLDDLHWADAASLELLTYLVRRLRVRPLCLLLTWRSEGAQQARLQQVITEARRASLATILALPRLDQAAVAELIQSAPSPLGTQTTPDTLSRRLYQETEGLPFFLVEYLAVLSKNTNLASGDDWSMPGGVRGLLQSRLAGVSQTGWQLLNTAAVIGRSFEFDTLRAASGRSDEEVVAGLEGLIEQGLVTEVGGERGLSYDFSHEKLRTLVYEQTSLARRRLMHRRVAEALVSGVRGRSDLRGFREAYSAGLVSQIAHHYRLAGQDSEAADYFKQAGEHARALYANAEALAHFRSALALGHPDAVALHEAIGDLHTLLGEYSAALTAYETAAALLGGQPSTPEERLTLSVALARVEHKLGDVHHRRGEWEAG
ncbi:MAG: AAA family ATPase [Anaerolineae bacterium]